MPPVVTEDIRGRAAGEAGFTLVELLVAMSIGLVVLIGALTLVDSGGRASTRLTDKAETVQRARIGMDRITRILRTQACLDDDNPPIASATADSVTFFSDTSADSEFRPRKVELTFDPTAATVVEKTWMSTSATPAATSPTWSYPATPSTTKLLLEKVGRIGTTPFFTYYSWQDLGTPLAPPLDPALNQDPLPANSVAKVVRVDVSLQAGPANGNTQADRKTPMTSQIYTRNADFSGQAGVGRIWGPRCG